MSAHAAAADLPGPRWHTWAPLVVASVAAASFLVFFLAPYLVNGLYRFPIQDVAGGFHDPKELWPYDSALGGPAGLGGVLTLFLGPMATMSALAASLFVTWRDRHVLDRASQVRLLAAVLVSTVTLAVLASPFGSALLQWFLD